MGNLGRVGHWDPGARLAKSAGSLLESLVAQTFADGRRDDRLFRFVLRYFTYVLPSPRTLQLVIERLIGEIITRNKQPVPRNRPIRGAARRRFA